MSRAFSPFLGLLALLLGLAPLFDAAPAQAGAPAPGTPEDAARMVFEGGHRLEAAQVAEHTWLNPEQRKELEAFFAARLQEFRAGGVAHDKLGYDFDKVEYVLLERDGDLARVGIRGPYAVLFPAGPQWNEDPGVVLVLRRDGVWKLGADQTRADLSLADYRRWLKDPSALGEPAPASGPSPLDVARAFCEAVYRIDGPAMRELMCRAMRDAGVADMADRALEEFARLGVDWSEVRHDFSGLRFELVRQEGGTAEVRLGGTYRRMHPVLGGEERPEQQLFLLKVEDGRWVVCE